MKYSKILKDIRARLQDNDKAFVTHYLQSPDIYRSLEDSYEENNIISDVTAKYTTQQLQELTLQFDIPFPPVVNPEFTFIDLFAGIGGFRIPLQWHGGKCVFSSEINKHAQSVYEANYGEFPFGDITTIPTEIIPDHDILCAGFPCQPFSISGKMKGFEDTRGTLIYEVFRIMAAKNPPIILLENVKQLVYHDHGRTLKTILNNIANLGYNYSCKVLNASDFGVPQNRERIIIIANNLGKKFDFTKIHTRPRKIIRDIIENDENNYELLKEPYTLLEKPTIQPSGLIFVGYRNKKIRKAGVRPGTENLSRVHKQPNRIYSVDGVHPALPSQESSGRFFVYDSQKGIVRKLTINECYRLMGFPENFIKDPNHGEDYRQIGNSVCIPMVEEIIKQIKEQLL